jgi:hypothetical protein
VIVDKYGRVGGSIDLAALAAMYAECDDEDLRAHYAEVAAESGVDLKADEPEADERSYSGPTSHTDHTAGPEPEPEPEPGDQAPPRAGAGSGRDVWAAYAESQGVEVTDDMTRDEIIAAVEEASDGNDDVS